MNSNRPAPVGLIKGLSYTFPTSGTIRLGYTRVTLGRGGSRRLPVKDDEFTLTTKVRHDDGEWVRHPLDAKLRKEHGELVEDADSQAVRKLRAIPVTIAFDRPELTMAEQFAAFTDRGSPRCVGDGNAAKRLQPDGTVSEEDCPGPRSCVFGQEHRCDAFLRLLVRVEGQSETAPPFILRSGSVNAVTDNRVTLEHWASMYGGRLAGLPFTFVLDAKQSALSRQSIFYYGRLEPRFASIEEGARLLREQRKTDEGLGIDRRAAEQTLLRLRSNGAFAEAADGDGGQIDDLVAGRFSDDMHAERHDSTIETSATVTRPRQAAAVAVQELVRVLSIRNTGIRPPDGPIDNAPAARPE